MPDFKETLMTEEIKSALKVCSVTKTIRIILALVICVSYVYADKWIIDAVLISLLFLLLFTLSFFGVFIQKLLEYNTQKMEERISLNADETNKALSDAFDEIEKLKEQIKKITPPANH